MTYKLVIIGRSGHHPLVTQHLAAYPQVHFAAYAPSFVGEEVAAYATTTPEPRRAYQNWRRMLDEVAPDIVVVCGRHDLNGPLSIEAARRGCHIISEKPAAHTLEELSALSDYLIRHNLLYASMLNMRYEAPFFTAQRLVREGTIGTPYLITGQKSYRFGDSRPAWYADPQHYGSSITWIGIHAFDFARWVSGVEFVSVAARHANLVHSERPGCQDVSTVIAQLANGGSATFTLDYLRPATAPTHGDDRLRIAGSEGVLEVLGETGTLRLINAQGDQPSYPLDRVDRTLFGDFMDALEGRGELLVPGSEALSITEFAIKAALAAETGTVQVM